MGAPPSSGCSHARSGSRGASGGHRRPAPALAGVDGCRGGWLCVLAPGDGAPLAALVAGSFGALLERLPDDSLVAVDIPIGLASFGARRCDVEARRCLGRGRASSVFPAPLRAILAAGSYDDACARRQAIEGARMSRQAFALLGKIREVDTLLLARPALRRRVRECHPEVSFREWAGRPLRHGKKSSAGHVERAALVDAEWPDERARLARLLPRGGFQRDDLLDAFAALWTARRIHQGAARTFPTTPERDACGLAMEIVV
jgi:predicted RNase H-like nuclease